MKYLSVLMVLALIVLAACTDGDRASKAKKETTVFDSQLNALDKARQIENVLQQSTDERQNTLDGQ